MGDPGETTAKQKAMTNYDVFVALSDKLDASDRVAAQRHLAVVTEIESIHGTLREHDKRIGAVERRDAPRSHSIALGAMAIAMWLIVVLAFVSALEVATHGR